MTEKTTIAKYSRIGQWCDSARHGLEVHVYLADYYGRGPHAYMDRWPLFQSASGGMRRLPGGSSDGHPVRIRKAARRHGVELPPLPGDNARFWTYCGGGWVKITLRPGQTLRWSCGGPTDEGWSAEAEEWTHEGHQVANTCHAEGRDCDGGYASTRSYVCPLHELRAQPMTCAEHGDSYDVPAWNRVSASQWDEYAEAMGY